ncbi:MAG TPA: hypothetical protein VGX03_22905 [Candidatus Binatia bacterium]|nr:hypothetical protein [Candidatus Binatia bacterium]
MEAKRYRKYAREIRYQAEASEYAQAKESLLKIAREYEALAAALESKDLK